MTHVDEIGHVQYVIDAAGMNAPGEVLLSAAMRVQSMFRADGIPVTWAVMGPQDALVQRLELATRFSDVTLQVPRGIAGPPTDRAMFQRWLAGALQGLRHQVGEVSTLFLPHGEWNGPAEILAQYGVRLVSFAVPRALRSRYPSCTWRHGLHWLMRAATIPGAGRFVGAWDAGYRAKQSLARSMRRRSNQQIVVGLQQFAGKGDKPWRSLQTLLKITRMALDAGTLCCETLGNTGARLAPVRTHRPMHSILRAA